MTQLRESGFISSSILQQAGFSTNIVPSLPVSALKLLLITEGKKLQSFAPLSYLFCLLPRVFSLSASFAFILSLWR